MPIEELVPKKPSCFGSFFVENVCKIITLGEDCDYIKQCKKVKDESSN